MSGCSYDAVCPNCQGETMCYSDHKPFDTVTGTCLECGFYYYTKASYVDLEELNAMRKEYNEDFGCPEEEPIYPPLTELPKQEFKW